MSFWGKETFSSYVEVKCNLMRLFRDISKLSPKYIPSRLPHSGYRLQYKYQQNLAKRELLNGLN